MREILFVMQLKPELHSDGDKLPQQAFSPRHYYYKRGSEAAGSYQESGMLPFLYLGQVLSLPASHHVPAE